MDFDEWWNSIAPKNSMQAFRKMALNAWNVAAKEEREACAKVCDEISGQAWALWETVADPIEQGRSIGADHCADAIRVRSNKES